MLEKVGLPAKPSMRGANWVDDASHCQGCSSQFTFFNRKHHCRRCGGLFCNTCTQQRMILRGQGDSAVRICDPCKKLEDAARFELRRGYKKNRKAKPTIKHPPMQEDEIPKRNLEADGAHPSSSSDIVTTSTEHNELSPASPEDMRKQAFEEKKRYKMLRGEGKSWEAIQAYKRGKELERQAAVLESTKRKNHGVASVPKRSEAVADRKQFPSQKVKRQKDDIVSELRELGWSDAELHDTDKKAENSSTEGELSKLLGEISQTQPVSRHSSGIDKTQVIAHKKKALMLKKDGKMAEAKEELKRAKILEKQLEEQELLAEDEESDDELAILIRSVNDGKEDVPSVQGISGLDLNVDQFNRLGDDEAVVSNFDVTDDDMNDAEIMSTLKSFGWTEDADGPVDIGKPKKEKEAKLLERDLWNPKAEKQYSEPSASLHISRSPYENSKLPQKSKLVIQKELLNLKKKALALRREGHVEEAEEELKKGKDLERQLEEMDKAPKVTETDIGMKSIPKSAHVHQYPSLTPNPLHEDDVTEVTDQDMMDPSLLSVLQNLGWEEDARPAVGGNVSENRENQVNFMNEPSIIPKKRARNKAEIQREILSVKRKALALRRQGRLGEAEEVLGKAKDLENELAETEVTLPSEYDGKFSGDSGSLLPAKKPENLMKRRADRDGEEDIIPDYSPQDLSLMLNPLKEPEAEVTEQDLQDPTLLSVLENLGSNEEVEYAKTENSSKLLHDLPVHDNNPPLSKGKTKSKAEIQRELLGVKRKALTLRRQGKSEEAEEELRKAKDLEYQLSETEVTHPSKYNITRSGDSSNLVPSTISRVGEDNKEVEPIGIIKNTIKLMDDLKSNDIALRRPGKLGEAEKLKISDDLENCLPNWENVKPSSISMTSDGFSASFPSGKQEDTGVIMNPDVDMLGLVTVAASKNENVSEVYSSVNPQKGSYPLGSESPTAFSPDVSQLDPLALQPAKNIEPLPSSSLHPNLIDFGSSDEHELRSKEEQTAVENMVTLREVSPSANLLDLLTGDLQDSHNLYVKHEEKPADSTGRLDSQLCSEKDNIGSNKNSVQTSNTHIEKALHGDPQRNLVPVTEANSTSGVDYSKAQVLAHKRKAVALKREGKLAEAREELRQAKLLEKRLEEANQHAGTNGESQQADITRRNTPVYHPVKEEVAQESSLETQKRDKQEHTQGRSLEPQKPMSGRERFKLQQESLAHKRQALKLRREGRMEESEAESELAKKLESQIEELDSQTLGAGNSNVKADDDAVESFLDPQLMSALKAIGWQEEHIGMLASSKPESKPEVKKEPRKDLGKNSSVSSNKTHIEQQIKAEKRRALNLKHAGKQAEALDALRSAKRLEKQLLSLDS